MNYLITNRELTATEMRLISDSSFNINQTLLYVMAARHSVTNEDMGVCVHLCVCAHFFPSFYILLLMLGSKSSLCLHVQAYGNSQ